MFAFWILAGLLLMAGYVFFLPLLWGVRSGVRVDRRQLNLLLHQERQEELRRETGDEASAALTAEWERELLSELSASSAVTQTSRANGRRVLIVAMLVAPLMAVLLYLQLGRPEMARMGSPLPATSAVEAEDFQATIAALAQRLKEHPDDLKGWMLLARSLMATDQVARALEAYEHALKLAPDDLDVRAFYAQALAENQEGDFSGKPQEILTDILRRQPDHSAALWFSGLAAAKRGETEVAVAYWERLKAQFSPESEDAQQLNAYIAAVKGEKPAPPKESSSGRSIRVRVSLAAALTGRVSPQDTVFIFARAAEGPSMPLAIVRKQVQDLPIEVTLDDSLALMRDMKLSAFPRVVVGARISKSGEALPRPGDLQGLSAPLEVTAAQAVSVVIQEEVR